MEQYAAFNATNFSLSYSDPSNTTIGGLSINSFLCPSEVQPQPKPSGTGQYGVANYNWNMGDWFVWGGLGSGAENRGAFGVNRSRRLSDFTDGLSNTLLASEVKTYQAVLNDCTLSTVSEPSSIPSPSSDPYTAVPEYRSGACTLETDAHAEWVDGQALETGFTTAWPPNKATLEGSTNVDVDLVGVGEKSGGPTYAAITARSYHPGGVNAMFGDGSVRFVKSTITGVTWRALGSVRSGEVISSDSY